MSLHTEICDAIVTQLQSQGWSPSFTPARRYPPALAGWDVEGGDLNDLQVSVVPDNRSREIYTRSPMTRRIYLCSIALQKKMPAPTSGYIDPLDTLAEAIADYLQLTSLTTTSNKTALWQGVDVDPIFDAEQLIKAGTYLSIQTHSYVVVA